MPDTQVICITPVRNEAWILERFLAAAELWADRIVLADQRSTDATRAIAARFTKVEVVDNHSPGYDEGARQRLLLAAARKIPGERLIVALDADEALTAGSWESAEWAAAKAAPPGTVFSFDWVNVLPGLDQAQVAEAQLPFAFRDDGTEHVGERIHSTRLPLSPGAPVRRMHAVKVLHLQYTAWARMRSKQRWYQAWEAVHHPDKRPVQIFRQYNRMLAFPPEELRPVDPAWFAGYERCGIHLTRHPADSVYWWDEEVLAWLLTRGRGTFRRIALWDIEWQRIAARTGVDAPVGALTDPRSRFERAVHRWLEATQRRGVESRATRWLQRLLIPLGW
jgi:hypothetical protein